MKEPWVTERWVIVCKGQPLDREHVGVLFDSEEAAREVCEDVNIQTTTGTSLEVRKVLVRPAVRIRGTHSRVLGRGWVLLGEAC